MTAEHRPVLLFSFANDRQDGARYLRNLPDEAHQIESALSEAHRNCEPIVRQNVTRAKIEMLLTSHAGRLAVFHFGGHAGNFQLLAEDRHGAPTPVHAAGLAGILGAQNSLKLVFLNGCSTEDQVEELLRSGVPVVIATSQAIDDAVATDFAASFYRHLGIGLVSLRTAYDLAAHSVRMGRGDNPRAM